MTDPFPFTTFSERSFHPRRPLPSRREIALAHRSPATARRAP